MKEGLDSLKKLDDAVKEAEEYLRLAREGEQRRLATVRITFEALHELLRLPKTTRIERVWEDLINNGMVTLVLYDSRLPKTLEGAVIEQRELICDENGCDISGVW